jgi:predicted nicotinamide N-methyase
LPSRHSRQHHQLLTRIHRRYPTRTEAITIAGRTFNFTRAADPNRVLDEIAAEEDRRERVSGNRKQAEQLRLPYWAELWDSARGLGQLLIERFQSRADRSDPDRVSSVLDLGCGMGFTGMVAASLGHRVTFADLEPPALLFAELNSLPFSPPARTRQLDWQTTRLNERFDLILGADILYERAQWEYLEPFWRAHLATLGSVFLGEPGRPTGNDFPEWITNQGWTLKRHEQIVPNHPRPIRLFEIHLQ